jgi:hypothetical protein
MRTTGGYTFALREGVKRLRIVAERRVGAGLRIVGVKAEPTRGGQLIARFSLTKSAEVEVKLLTLTGRLVSVVQPRRLMLWVNTELSGTEEAPMSVCLKVRICLK